MNRKTVIEIEQYLIDAYPPGLRRTSIYDYIRRARLMPDDKRRYDFDAFLDAYKAHGQYYRPEPMALAERLKLDDAIDALAISGTLIQ